MEKCDSVILISPTVGEYNQNNIFLRNMNADEIKFLGDDLIVEYRKKHQSYSECIKDLKEKMKRIKQILEE